MCVRVCVCVGLGLEEHRGNLNTKTQFLHKVKGQFQHTEGSFLCNTYFHFMQPQTAQTTVNFLILILKYLLSLILNTVTVNLLC